MINQIKTDQSVFLHGKIIGVTGGSPNPNTGQLEYFPGNTFYKIAGVTNGQIVDFEKQRPSYSLWSPEIELDPFRLLNKNIVGCRNGNAIEWHFWEPPKLGECPSVTNRMDQMLAEKGFGIRVQEISGPATPTIPSTPTPTPAPGES